MTAHSTRHRQRGAAALLVTTLLCLATLLVVAYANRNLVVEERASANQYRSTQAMEAAEAGLEWALARLNDPARVGPDCRPSADAAAMASRQRWLRFQAAAGTIAAATWNDAGTAVPLHAACRAGASGWTCNCPASGAPSLPAPTDSTTAPTFVVEFVAGTTPGLVDVVARGCTRSDALCDAASDASHEASARLQASVALLPALRSTPSAALTVRGNVDAGSAALGAHNRDAGSGGLAVQAGGQVAASALRVTVPAGSAEGNAVAAGDAGLAGLDSGRFLARYLGMSESLWAAQPAVTRVACDGSCAGALSAAVAAGGRLLFIDGDATIAGPATFGSPDDPVALVVRGGLALDGDVTVHGFVAAASLHWNGGAAPGALVRGAAVASGDYGGDAAPDFAHDDAVLAQLHTRAGTFVRVNGSWKDF